MGESLLEWLPSVRFISCKDSPIRPLSVGKYFKNFTDFSDYPNKLRKSIDLTVWHVGEIYVTGNKAQRSEPFRGTYMSAAGRTILERLTS